MNSQDPLAELRDIHLPQALGWWPPAPGWWLLAVLLLGGCAMALWLGLRWWRRGAYRRSAERQLTAAWAHFRQNGDAAHYLQVLNRILRRAALSAYPADLVAPLQGEAWLAFLDRSLKEDRRPFTEGPGQELLHGPYRPPGAVPPLAELHQLAIHWLGEHRPVARRELEGLRAGI